jgi:hypothetical protein
LFLVLEEEAVLEEVVLLEEEEVVEEAGVGKTNLDLIHCGW